MDGQLDGTYVSQSHFGPGDGADIVFFLKRKRIVVSFCPSRQSSQEEDLKSDQIAPCLEDSLIRQISEPLNEETFESDHALDQVLDTVLDLGQAVFDTVAPTRSVLGRSYEETLHSIIYPQTFYFRLLTAQGSPAIIPIDANESYSNFEPDFEFYEEDNLDIDESLPKYSTTQVSVGEIQVKGNTRLVAQVLADGKKMLCKVHVGRFVLEEMEKEMADLYDLRQASIQGHTLIRVPPLLGYVKHPEAGCVIGFVREWIPGVPLRDIRIATTPESQRHKWASQIADTVKQLHDIEVVWGDGKPDNVIIDENDNAWLIDFGGGWTRGWVPEELVETIEGDDHAVKKIMEFLNGDYKTSETAE
ncbi:hypothetical protein F5B22DRAFT_631660 [Xylaria bambusicola]|uniref:uncharacterized protein n=1 Tax=Xylaria bambusicola TaxID=326684 RepID=UPI0020076147|nr:uncharacterized protein F5B22DRAFT_631660 [Xylaria bambusicola]KAI0502853.1 hypothetical protein F5B22DRAFT_631660 [Xylaria bambusicola]